ncbi:MAG: DNA internalization-related competence protein ComEC/Rec2 [bacterium]|nr:DNA internalization-related competence protein ComEC/Rec2 [bacterium]
MTVPFALGVFVEDTLMAPIRLCLVLCLVAGVLWILRRSSACAEISLGIGLGALALALRLHAPVPIPDPGHTVLSLLEAPVRDAFGCRALAHAHSTHPGRISLRLPEDACHLLPGQRVAAHVEFERPRPQTNPGGSDRRRRLARRGVHVTGRITSGRWVLLASGSPGVPALLERARRAIGNALDPIDQSRRSSALLRALATGDRQRLDFETRSAFSRSGTAHLLAVSGLHVGWVLALVHGIGLRILRHSSRLFILRRAGSLAQIAGVSCACLYAALSGFGVPSLRAATMAFAGALAISRGRSPAGANALAFACLVVLATDPGSLFDAGFALSFCAVAGLLLWRPPTAAFSGLVHCTLAATLATAPLVVAIGAPLPRDALAANAVAVPYFGLVVVPAALLTGAAGALFPDLSGGFSTTARVAAEFGIELITWLESPDLSRALGGAVELAAAVSLSGFALRLLLVQRLVPATLCIAGAAGGLVLAAMDGPRPNDTTSALFFDVGHGDAVLLRDSEHAWLVDAGPRVGAFDAGRHVLAPGLRALGVRRLDVLAITHADNDHIGGARSVIQSLAVGELWLTRLALESEAAGPLRDAAAARGIPIRVVAAGQKQGDERVSLQVLWPVSELLDVSSNLGSLVLRFETPGGCTFLSGDLPVRAERTLAAMQTPCSLLKLGHHGSRTSSDPLLLDALSPLAAVASSGRRRRAELPHRSVRTRLAERSIPLWITRRHGAIEARMKAGGLVILPFLSAPIEELTACSTRSGALHCRDGQATPRSGPR